MIVIPILLWNGSEIVQTKNLRLQMFRSLNTCVIIFCTYIGYENLPVAVASAIGSSEPLLVASLSLLLGYEKGWKTLFAIFGLGVAGMLLIIDTSSLSFSTSNSYLKGLGALIVANILCALGHYVIRAINNTDKSLTTLSYGCFFSCSFLLLFNTVSAMSGNALDFSVIKLYAFQIISLGLSSAAAAIIAIEMFRFIDPNTHISIQNLQIPIALICGAVLNGDPITIRSLLGIAAIFTSTSLIFFRKVNCIQGPNCQKNRLPKDFQDKINVYIGISYLILTLGIVTINFVVPQTAGKSISQQCCS
jgi:drug/metabolite transporter (DMT)-like permease